MCLVTGDVGLPNSSRIAATTTLTGFHAANHCSTVGSELIGTNALLRNVSGNTTMKPMPITASGERTASPIYVPIQIIAEQNRSSSSERGADVQRSRCARASRRSSPALSRTTIDSAMPASSAR